MSEEIKVWLIEDSDVYRRGLYRSLDRADGILCSEQFAAAEPAIEKLNCGEEPDVILLDVGLPGISGLDALSEIKEINSDICVVILTVFDDEDKIFNAVCSGARGYLLKTSSTENVIDSVRQAAKGGAPMSPVIASRVLTLFSQMASDDKDDEEKDYGLTPREFEVLKLLADGLAGKEIANLLCVSAYTITNHLRNIYTKLHVTTNTGAVAKAIREGII